MITFIFEETKRSQCALNMVYKLHVLEVKKKCFTLFELKTKSFIFFYRYHSISNFLTFSPNFQECKNRGSQKPQHKKLNKNLHPFRRGSKVTNSKNSAFTISQANPRNFNLQLNMHFSYRYVWQHLTNTYPKECTYSHKIF